MKNSEKENKNWEENKLRNCKVLEYESGRELE